MLGVQKSVNYLINKLNEYYFDEKKTHDYKVKVIIPSNYVTKLIGKCKAFLKDKLFFKSDLLINLKYRIIY